MKAVTEVTAGDIIPIDGKTPRRSFDRGAEDAHHW
jgi:hypothetical protein